VFVCLSETGGHLSHTLRVAFHLELMYNEHNLSLAVLRVNVPFTRPVCEIFVRVIRRLYVTTATRDVLYAPCIQSISQSINQ